LNVDLQLRLQCDGLMMVENRDKPALTKKKSIIVALLLELIEAIVE